MAKILVIDDCEELREVVGDILTDAGHDVIYAESEDTAAKVFNDQSVGLVLCDLALPVEMDDAEDGVGEPNESMMVGVNLIHRLSKLRPGTPIILMSGKLPSGALDGMRQFGAQAVLPKPFGREELLSAVSRVLR